MLEAERAGAKALVVFMSDHPRSSEAWTTLRKVQADEARNCALIGKLLEQAGTPYSHETGEFYAKAIAVNGPIERIEFLVKGLRWAVRAMDEGLKSLDGAPGSTFLKMRDSHLRSIAACESLARSLRAS
ncbi:MAG: hypothetical protein HY058_03725 [Proteobacteria bacterium]|nr:hypothetical protein [Pseudomonadota bacterium]